MIYSTTYYAVSYNLRITAKDSWLVQITGVANATSISQMGYHGSKPLINYKCDILLLASDYNNTWDLLKYLEDSRVKIFRDTLHGRCWKPA